MSAQEVKIDMDKAVKRYRDTSIPDHCLAEIVKVTAVRDIPDADRIQSYKVLGWNCIAKKDEFGVGDLVVYVKIGAVLDPSVEHFTFLEGKPLKTKKLRGSISQGLIGPTSWLPTGGNYAEGDDVTSALRVMKFIESEEKGVYDKANGLRPRPEWIPKTDEERVQNLKDKHWEALKGAHLYVTRKEDGCSATYYYHAGDKKFGMLTRNYEIEEKTKDTAAYMKMAEAFDIEKKMTAYGKSIAVQGEIVGPGINCGRLKLPSLDFRVFNVWSIDDQRYLDQPEVAATCSQLGLHMVPAVGEVDVTNEMLSAEFWLDWAGKVEYAKDLPAEGIVVKNDTGGGKFARISFKAISNVFLLKHGK